MPMMVVIVEFEVRAGAESKFESALKHMQEQVKKYDGFLGEAPCRSLDSENKLVSLFYWRDRESIEAWREDPEHLKVQQLGRGKIFTSYKIRVCELEREYGWDRSE
jgi:heme-degrading monooxygenase HmoA